MGEPAVINNSRIIDDTFAGLENPINVIELGKDVDGERPGATLVNAVKQFGKDGGFRLIQEQRNAAIAADETADEITKRNRKIEIEITIPTSGDALEKDRDVVSE